MSIIVSILLGYFFVLGWTTGLILSKCLSSKKEGAPGKIPSIILPIHRWKIHIHHWITSSCVMGITYLIDFHFFMSPAIAYGVMSGIIFQGIYCYNDWHRIVKSKLQTISNPKPLEMLDLPVITPAELAQEYVESSN